MWGLCFPREIKFHLENYFFRVLIILLPWKFNLPHADRKGHVSLSKNSPKWMCVAPVLISENSFRSKAQASPTMPVRRLCLFPPTFYKFYFQKDKIWLKNSIEICSHPHFSLPPGHPPLLLV